MMKPFIDLVSDGAFFATGLTKRRKSTEGTDLGTFIEAKCTQNIRL